MRWTSGSRSAVGFFSCSIERGVREWWCINSLFPNNTSGTVLAERKQNILAAWNAFLFFTPKLQVRSAFQSLPLLAMRLLLNFRAFLHCHCLQYVITLRNHLPRAHFQKDPWGQLASLPLQSGATFSSGAVLVCPLYRGLSEWYLSSA